eukprot:3933210-Rhodomonas_salina.2
MPGQGGVERRRRRRRREDRGCRSTPQRRRRESGERRGRKRRRRRSKGRRGKRVDGFGCSPAVRGGGGGGGGGERSVNSCSRGWVQVRTMTRNRRLYCLRVFDM